MKFLLVAALVIVAATEAKKRYDGYKVLRLYPEDEDQVNIVKDMHEIIGLDFWTDTEVMVPPNLLQEVEEGLREKGLRYEVINENVQNDIDEEEREIEQKTYSAKGYDLNNWNTYEQIVLAIDDFVANCPSGYTCTRQSLGKSYEGRDLPALEITSGDKPIVYLDSLIHSREWIAGATVLLIANRLINGNDADAERMRSSYNWFIAPIVNPDGYVFTWTKDRFWRKNRQTNPGQFCDGTDLNRNFAVNWGWSGTSSFACAEHYGGYSGGSAVETRLLQTKMRQLGKTGRLYAVVSYHAFAKMWLHAYGYTTQPGGKTCAKSDHHSKINYVSEAAHLAVEKVGGQDWVHGPVCQVIYPASGSTVDYAHDKVGCKYAFTPELRGSSFNPHHSEIKPSYFEQWAGLVAMVDAIQEVEK